MIANAQESILQVKFKNEQLLQSLKIGSNSSLKLKSNAQTVNLIPSYPNAKTPELKLYYDVKVFGEKEASIVALASENVFQEINDYSVAFPTTEECITTNDSVFADGSDYAIELVRANCAWKITKGNRNLI
jgi:hypothetical protein